MPLPTLDNDEVASLYPYKLTNVDVGGGREFDALPRRQFNPYDLNGMVRPTEHLLSHVSALWIAPNELLARSGKAPALAFRAEHETGKREIEGTRKPHQYDSGRADLRAFDFADGCFGNAGTFGEIGE